MATETNDEQFLGCLFKQNSSPERTQWGKISVAVFTYNPATPLDFLIDCHCNRILQVESNKVFTIY
jgi:hypothetical protein